MFLLDLFAIAVCYCFKEMGADGFHVGDVNGGVFGYNTFICRM